MIRRLVLLGAVLAMSTSLAQAQDDMMGDHPPMHPEVILAPPEGFEPPSDMPPPPMTDDPEEARAMMLEHFFGFMDADGSGAVDLDEFRFWVRDFRMPPPDGMMPGGMHDGDMHDGDSGMDGVLREGEGDLADLDIAPECSDELRDSELGPQAEGVPCGDKEGNLLFRTICNMPGYQSVAISLPDGRAAGCFGLEALRGEISFEIIREDDGTVIWDTSMGKDSYRDLKIDGPGVYQIKSTGGSPDGAVTVKFVDVNTDM